MASKTAKIALITVAALTATGVALYFILNSRKKAFEKERQRQLELEAAAAAAAQFPASEQERINNMTSSEKQKFGKQILQGLAPVVGAGILGLAETIGRPKSSTSAAKTVKLTTVGDISASTLRKPGLDLRMYQQNG